MTKVTLYYADWCGHCTKFKPTWEGIKQVFKLNNISFFLKSSESIDFKII